MSLLIHERGPLPPHIYNESGNHESTSVANPSVYQLAGDPGYLAALPNSRETRAAQFPLDPD